MKKLLLGTTALVGAVAFTSAATAQSVEVGGALDVSISGSTNFGVEYTDEDFDFGVDDGEPNGREFFFNQDHEIIFEADGVDDATGTRYGVSLALEAQDGTGAGFDTAWTYISGNWGEFRLGDDDAATDQLLITSTFVAAGSGGVDGDQRTVPTHNIEDSGASTKILYFTPEVAGFQGGVSYAIKGDDRGEEPVFGSGADFDPTTGNLIDSNTSDHIDLAANWQGSFGGADVGVYGGATFFSIDALDENATNYQFGGYGELFGIGLAGSIGFEDEDLEALGGRDLFWNIGAGGDFAGVDLSFNFHQDDFEDADLETQEQYIVSASVPLLPGVSLGGDVAYVSDYEGGDEDGVNALLQLDTSF